MLRLPVPIAANGRPVRRFFITLVCMLALCTVLSGMALHYKMGNERLRMEQLLLEKSISVRSVLGKFLFKTYALAAFVVQNEGNIRGFNIVAPALLDDPAINNFVLAPEGVVSHVYPLTDNEKLLGYSLLGDGDGNEEARLAKKYGELVIAGPFTLMQGGGMGVAGRLPVSLYTESGERRFWGLVSVTLKYPDVLDRIGLRAMEDQGMAYTLWRINPATQQPQIIARSTQAHGEDAPFVERQIKMQNAYWYLKISPLRTWFRHPGFWIMLGVGLAASISAAYMVFSNDVLNIMKTELENMVQTDSLTGLLNRKGLFDALESLIRRGDEFTLAYIDLNYFKQINDSHGHNVGDLTLQEFTRRVRNRLTSAHLFARVGGDEFILVDKGEQVCATDIRDVIAPEFRQPFSLAGCPDFHLSFSCGSAVYPRDGQSIDDLVACADKRMYVDKRKRYNMEQRRRVDDWEATG